MASREPAPVRRRTRRDATFPVLPVAIGMIVLGLVIGAAIGTQHQRGTTVTSIVATQVAAKPTLAPGPGLTEPPVAQASQLPTATPLPSEAPTPTPLPAPSPRRTMRATPVPATPIPSPAPPAKTNAVVAAASKVHALSSIAQKSKPVAAMPVTATAAPARRIAPVTVAQASTAEPPPEDSGDAALASDAKQAVRTYLQALIAGDDSTASAQLLANSGSSASRLSERDFLDASSRIVDISARVTSAATASVDADIQTANGLYYGHYEVRRLDTGVTLIQEHSFVKS